MVEAYLTIASAEQKAISTVAYRTALFTRMKHTSLPKNERELLKKPEPKKTVQTIEEQLVMAKKITIALGGTVH